MGKEERSDLIPHFGQRLIASEEVEEFEDGPLGLLIEGAIPLKCTDRLTHCRHPSGMRSDTGTRSVTDIVNRPSEYGVMILIGLKLFHQSAELGLNIWRDTQLRAVSVTDENRRALLGLRGHMLM